MEAFLQVHNQTLPLQPMPNFDACTKNAIAVFETNDPLADLIEVPVVLKVTGKPIIVVNPTTVDFGSLW